MRLLAKMATRSSTSSVSLYIYKDTEEVEERVAIFANSLIAQRLHELEQVPLRHTHHS